MFNNIKKHVSTNNNQNYHKIGTSQQIAAGSSYTLKSSYSLPVSPINNSFPGNKKFNFDL